MIGTVRCAPPIPIADHILPAIVALTSKVVVIALERTLAVSATVLLDQAQPVVLRPVPLGFTVPALVAPRMRAVPPPTVTIA